MKTSDFSPELRPFAKKFSALAYHHGYDRVFDDFLTFTMCCFALKTEEALYLETAKKYSKEELGLFSELIGELMLLYSKCDTWTDPIGTFYEQIANNYKKAGFGQYFTPVPVVGLMSQLVGTPQAGELVNDPACGSGRMLLSMHFQSKGKIQVYGEDLDGICVKMTCINLLFHGAVGEVIQRNSLSLNHWIVGWRINPVYKLTGIPSIERLPRNRSFLFASTSHEHVKTVSQSTVNQSIKGDQLSFDF